VVVVVVVVAMVVGFASLFCMPLGYLVAVSRNIWSMSVCQPLEFLGPRPPTIHHPPSTTHFFSPPRNELM